MVISSVWVNGAIFGFINTIPVKQMFKTLIGFLNWQRAILTKVNEASSKDLDNVYKSRYLKKLVCFYW